MINSLLSFGAKSVNPELLEQTLTNRKIVVDEIEHKCVTKILKYTTYQSLVIAPRGSGKTHMTKVLHHRLINNEDIRDKCVIAYMSEDEVGIDSLTDLIVSMFRAFIRYGEQGSEILNEKIEEAADISNVNERITFIKTTLNEFANDRIIILLIENFDQIMEALKKNGQEELRDFIHEYNNLSIIATSQNLIQGLQKSDYPFYNFFNIFNLKKLTYDESVDFFKKIASVENHTNLIKEMDTPTFNGKLKAIYELTEGNHRLLVTFYSFLKAEFKSEFSNVFVKVMNDLKPYYEQFINVLSTQQKKIVKLLSQHRRAISGKEIARACFIEPNTLSKQTSLLYEMRMIDKTKSGKDVFYELREPLMRISFEIGDNPNGIASLFVNFLSSFYSSAEIGQEFLKYQYGAKFQVEEILPKYVSKANMHHMALPNSIKNIIKSTETNLSTVNDWDELILKINAIVSQFKKSNTLLSIEDLRSKILNLKTIPSQLSITLMEFADLLTDTITLTLKEKNNAVLLLETDKGNNEYLPALIESWKSSTELMRTKFGPKLYNTFLDEVHKGANNVLENKEVLIRLSESDKFQDDQILNFLIGRLSKMEGDNEMAFQFFEKCLSIDNKDHEIYKEIITLSIETKNYQKGEKYVEMALAHFPDDELFYAFYMAILILTENTNELEKQILLKLSTENEKTYFRFLRTSVFPVLLMSGSPWLISHILPFLLDILNEHPKNKSFWPALASAILTLLPIIDKTPDEHAQILETTLNETISEHKESIIPLKFLSVGIAYLKKGDKNALFELSKEERKVLKEYVLDLIEKEK